jgi:hypothetical protein
MNLYLINSSNYGIVLIAKYVFRDVVRGIYQDTLYLQHVALFCGTRISGVSFRPIRRVRPIRHRFSRDTIAQEHYVQICNSEVHPKLTISKLFTIPVFTKLTVPQRTLWTIRVPNSVKIGRKNVESREQICLYLYIKYVFYSPNFHETDKGLVTWGWNVSHPISPRSVKKYGK